MDRADEAEGSLQWPDYTVIGVVLLISAGIGVYYRFSGGRQKTSAEYFSANHSMNVPMLAVALMVAFMSAIGILGISGEAYINGAGFSVVNIGFSMGTPVAAFLFVPVFFKLQYMSVYEYLEKRFGVLARLVASLANVVQMLLYTGVVLYAPALALEATTGLPSMGVVLVVGFICTFYSTIGGMKAVLATDIFQGLLMFGSLFAVIGVAWSDFDGGIYEIWDIAGKNDRLDTWNFDPDPTIRHTFWSLTFGGLCFYLTNFGVNQVAIQRLLVASSLGSAQIALFLSTPIIISMSVLTSLSGFVLYAWFEGCDPVAAGQIFSFDQVMPYFAKIRMSKIPGLSGLFIAGVFSASLSTVSAALNSLGAVAVADYIQPAYGKLGKELSDGAASLYGKFFSFFSGLLVVVVAYGASKLGSIMQLAILINGAMGGPVLGLFCLGMFFETANEKGSVIGTLIGLAFSVWVITGQPKPMTPELPVSIESCSNSSIVDTTAYQAKLLAIKASEDIDYFYMDRVSYMWICPMGLVVTIVCGYIASLALRICGHGVGKDLEPDLFTPILASRMRRRQGNAAKTTSQVFVLTPK